ncbi:LacI family transcriptional regulator [Catellatospora sp. TT07R-123]|uniref:LacI family DNA-binding transcriptional regulator n=1 Tax=Catellatospora sp. TT07R-123 TaxID=2733863 RepID=UPI001B1AE60A|nr:LacI family DNA-binding transcriptional regulator [Catellatospora sp. TT07R-123]GHJ47612.1 LacI family transcriptional regulator [Catellatospora sp. TT07R-123]
MVSAPRDRVTVRQIAAQTGLSIATVSRVLNGHPHVAERTRELVRQAMDRFGDAAPSPRSAAPRAVDPGPAGVFVRCPYQLTDYFGLIVSSIAETLHHYGRHLVLDAGQIAQNEDVLPTLAQRPGIEGAILILPPEHTDDLQRLRASRLPFVVVDPRTPPPRDIPAVSAAHFSGARAVTEHLLQLGHRRIGVLAGPHNWLAGKARLAGHNSALADVGMLADPSLVRSAEPTTAFGHAAAAELLDLPEPPTAVIGFNDKVAVGIISAAADRGLRVPDDLSVTGFDDIDLAQATNPKLTTVRQPLEEMGRMAVSLIIRLLDKHRLEALHIELATELVVRGSTGPRR